MLGVGVLLLTVTGCVSIVGVYIILGHEDWKWQWKCWSAGGATSMYVMLFSIYFFYQKTRYFVISNSSMSGTFQTVFYFGYTLLGCISLFLMLGSQNF